ncbi:hypothetical protein [Pseudofrankia sp. BMG5.37]|uniref:hypothetical protein n=1 Tax=Pseudofrankia sp. BMG5.37 TaxID=3050035 RepID=UPI00289AFE2A|nr:hypothetical protein [Pseudofrankia sp. BMG5.37]
MRGHSQADRCKDRARAGQPSPSALGAPATPASDRAAHRRGRGGHRPRDAFRQDRRRPRSDEIDHQNDQNRGAGDSQQQPERAAADHRSLRERHGLHGHGPAGLVEARFQSRGRLLTVLTLCIDLHHERPPQVSPDGMPQYIPNVLLLEIYLPISFPLNQPGDDCPGWRFWYRKVAWSELCREWSAPSGRVRMRRQIWPRSAATSWRSTKLKIVSAEGLTGTDVAILDVGHGNTDLRH